MASAIQKVQQVEGGWYSWMDRANALNTLSLRHLVGRQSEIVQAGGWLQGSGGGARSGWWRSNGRGDHVQMGATTKT